VCPYERHDGWQVERVANGRAALHGYTILIFQKKGQCPTVSVKRDLELVFAFFYPRSVLSEKVNRNRHRAGVANGVSRTHATWNPGEAEESRHELESETGIRTKSTDRPTDSRF
jgi:hypothetical protein